jgi:TolB-like protein
MKIRAFFRELRRRSVFKVALIYAVVGWLLAQVAVNVFPNLLLPPWTVTFVIVLLIIGFPIAIVLAWAYELTPESVRLTVPGNLAAEGQKVVVTGPKPHLALAGPPASETAAASISVLPFQNLIASGEHTYLADAMTIELHSLLSRCHDLRVVSHQSSAAHALARSGLREISTQLDVQYVITGSVALRKDKFFVTVELDDSLKDTVLWSERYEIGIDDVWDTQRRIAESVVSTFGGERMRAEIQRVGDATGNESARQLVQKARAYVLDYGPSTIAKAKTLLQRALELDPGYADAQAALGLVIAEATLNGASADWAADRRTAVEMAERAEREAPNDPIVLRAAGGVHAYTGNYERSLALLRRAAKLAPFELGAWGYMGWPLVASGRAEDLAELHLIIGRLLSSAPRHPGRPYWLFHESVALTCEDRCREAREHAAESVAEQPGFSLGLMSYANVLGRLGEAQAARATAERCMAANRHMTPTFYAELMAVLTDQETVIDKRSRGLRASGLLV